MSSGFNVIRRHSFDETGVRIKELTQALATARSKIEGSQLETDDIRSQGRMDHSTIKLNDERLSFGTVLSSGNTDFYYELPNEPDLKYLKAWFMLDHLGARIRDISGFQNDAIISGHPTLRRALLNLGFQQLETSPATPVMLFNSGTDVVSQNDGEYIWIPDNDTIKFTKFENGFSIHFRFNCLNFNTHFTSAGGSFSRRFASKTDDADNGWNVIVYPTGTVFNNVALHGGVEIEIRDNGINYARRTVGYTAGLFYQIVVTYDRKAGPESSDRIKIYTGGVENSMDSNFGTILTPTTTNLRIGARSSQTGFFHGYIHDFRMWMDKVLTQQEVTNINTNEITIEDIPKGHIFIVQYALVQTPLVSKRHRWQTIGRIIKVKVHRFSVIELVIKPKIHKWNLFHRILPLRTHKFTIVELVMRLLTLVYDQGGLVTTTKKHKFNIKTKVTKTKTHKFSLGGLQTQYQRFVKSTTAGTNITQEVTYTSTPQALIVWSNGGTADNTLSNHFHIYYGFSDGSHHACVSGFSKDNLTTSDTFSGHKNDKVISLMDNTVGVMASEATVSFANNKATFNWTTNDTNAVYIHTLALWGLTNVEVKTFTVGTTSSGNRTYTLNNTAMTPRFLNTINNSDTVGWRLATGQAIAIGAATSSTRQFSVVNVNRDGQSTASDTYTAYETDRVVLAYDDDSGAEEHAATLSSFGSANGQFVLNWTNPTSNIDKSFSVLAIDSQNVDVGLITQPATTGTQIVSTATNVNLISGLMVFSNGQTTNTVQAAAHLCIGGASGTGSTVQGLTVVAENDAANPTASIRSGRTGKVIKTVTPNAIATSSTVTSEADLSSISTANQFTLNWTTANATARKSHYIVFGR